MRSRSTAHQFTKHSLEMPTLREALFPAGFALGAGQLLLCVEHGPDELGVPVLRALAPEHPPPVDLHVAGLPPPTPAHALCAVLPARSPRADAAALRHARHVVVVRALGSGAARDVHGSVALTKADGRWRRDAPQTWRFRLRRDGAVDVFR